MQKLESVEFDHMREHTKLGIYWKNIENTVEGATPMLELRLPNEMLSSTRVN